MKLGVILMALGGFVVGLGGSTAMVVMRTPAKPAAHAAGADSTATEHTATKPATAHAPADSAAEAPRHVAPPVPPSPTTTAARDTASHASPSPSTHATATSAAMEESAAGYRQVARVLSSMKPADAAKIAAFLSDDQVEGILGQLGVRQAASLMTELPTERAAALSRRIMKHADPSGGGHGTTEAK